MEKRFFTHLYLYSFETEKSDLSFLKDKIQYFRGIYSIFHRLVYDTSQNFRIALCDM